MKKLASTLPHYVYPTNSDASAPVLLFLHGIGEGFNNNGELSPQNLFKQGPLKYLGILPLDHPLRSSFTLVAPQLPDRDTSWSDVAGDVKKIVERNCPDSERLYIFGFSKGGLGAFQVANALNADALVTADASPLELPPEEAINQWVRPLQQRPFWAIYTSYAAGERFQKIQHFNELLTQHTHDNLTSVPKVGSQLRSLVKANVGEPGKRHGWICDEASRSATPYEWLLQH